MAKQKSPQQPLNFCVGIPVYKRYKKLKRKSPEDMRITQEAIFERGVVGFEDDIKYIEDQES